MSVVESTYIHEVGGDSSILLEQNWGYNAIFVAPKAKKLFSFPGKEF